MELTREKLNTIILESPVMYREVCGQIKKSLTLNDDSLILEENGRILCNSREMDVLESLFSINHENKRIVKAIIDDVSKMAMSEQYYMETQTVLNHIENLMIEMEYEFPYQIQMESVELSTLLKATVKGVHMPEKYPEMLDEYIKVLARLLNIKVVFLFGMAKLFTEQEWKAIHQDAEYENVYLVVVEQENSLKNSNKVIVDYDGCRIV